MFWPKMILMEAASDDGAPAGGDDKGDKAPKSTKLKVGDREYEPADVESAVSLFNALRDPETGMEIVETMARKAGLLDKKGEVNKDLSDKKKESLSKKVLQKALGKDYEQFADKVGPAFDEIIESYLDQKFGDMESTNSKSSWESHVDKFQETHTLTKEIEDTMRELMADSPPATKRDGFNAQKYLTRMYNMAISELDIEPPKSKGKGSSKQSKSEDGDDLPEIVFRDRPKNATIQDAVEAAMKGIRFK